MDENCGLGFMGSLTRLKLGPERRRFGDGEAIQTRCRVNRVKILREHGARGSQTFRAERWERRSVCVSLNQRSTRQHVGSVCLVRGLGFSPNSSAEPCDVLSGSTRTEK